MTREEISACEFELVWERRRPEEAAAKQPSMIYYPKISTSPASNRFSLLFAVLLPRHCFCRSLCDTVINFLEM